ncbi:MAG: hypothetical protein JST00_01845 [Deltaproteobacteria bacterium]|nr:hypothetical protein [Deltaproteobacteria bacterium]
MGKKLVDDVPSGASFLGDRRTSGFRPAARSGALGPRLEDLADSLLDEDTATNVDPHPPSMMASSGEAVTARDHVVLDDLLDDALIDDADDDVDGMPTVEARIDSARMRALLVEAGLPPPFEGPDPLDGDTMPVTDDDPYDDTSPTLPAPPKPPRTK